PPLQFTVFPGTPGGVYDPTGGVAHSAPGGPGIATATYVAPTTNWYPIVVYRPDSQNAGTSVTYDFGWNQDAVDVQSGDLPGELALSNPWPNPMNDRASLELALPRAGRVELAIYDLAGRRLRTITDAEMPAG